MKHYWRIMRYKCNGCGGEIEMYLEDGVEGPEDIAKRVETTTPPEWRDEVPIPSVTLRFTPAGRMIIPSPFTMACRLGCEPGRSYMSHINWHADREANVSIGDTMTIPFWHFAYIDPIRNPQACGQPKGPTA